MPGAPGAAAAAPAPAAGGFGHSAGGGFGSGGGGGFGAAAAAAAAGSAPGATTGAAAGAGAGGVLASRGAPPPIAPPAERPGFMTDVPFTSLGSVVSAQTLAGLTEGFKYTHMTAVQHATLGPCLEGHDVLAKARTGTGKTIGFLVPVVERLVRVRWPARARSGAVGALIISPTRELATQISKEAAMLTSRIPGFTVHCVFGGMKIAGDHRAFRNKPQCHILVATPGRLIDHLKNTPGFVDRLARMENLVLDECDQLLDMGFRPAIREILAFLRPSAATRQTLLFSATVPSSVMDIVREALRPAYKTIDTVGKEESTHSHVAQYHMTVPPQDQFAVLLMMLRSHVATVREYKVLVFFPTARLAGFGTALFRAAGLPPLEIHSRKSQSHRTKVSDQVRKNTRVILFSSDVSGRGLDYPNITLVVQFGAPSNRDQYIHRLGRTARAGAGGEGVLLLAPFEARSVMARLKGLPIESPPAEPPAAAVAAARADIAKGLVRVDDRQRGMAYQSFLGFYNSLPGLKIPKAELVKVANEFATKALGCPAGHPPAMLKSTVGKMGLKGVPGLNIVSRLPGM